MVKKLPMHIRILNWAYKHSIEGFTLKELKEGLDLNDNQFLILLKDIAHRNLFFSEGEKKIDFESEFNKKDSKINVFELWDGDVKHGKDIYINNQTKYFISFEGHAILQDYYELHEARENALNAQKSARTAIYISIVGLIISFVIGVISILVNIVYGENGSLKALIANTTNATIQLMTSIISFLF